MAVIGTVIRASWDGRTVGSSVEWFELPCKCSVMLRFFPYRRIFMLFCYFLNVGTDVYPAISFQNIEDVSLFS
jgi:hypothetical protein